jgi:hypothetical protein
MSNFVIRASCPGCSSLDFEIFYSSSFTENPLRKYLHNFYDPQGGVEFEYLTGGATTRFVNAIVVALFFKKKY